MTASNATLTDLADRLRNGTLQRLNAEELDVVLGWITRAQRSSVVEFETLLGDPDADPMLLRQVFEQLDVVLFFDGDLNEAAASVTASVAEAGRRARYRRLMAAFHPDRSPDLAPWLTPRSQAIHRAYTLFRRGESGALALTKPVRPAYAGQHVPKRPRKMRFPNIHFGPGLLPLLRSQLRDVRHLEAKILAVLGTIFFFPVLVLSLTQQPVPVSNGLPLPANPNPAAANENASLPESTLDSADLSLRNLGERLSTSPIADDDSVHMIDSNVSPLVGLTSHELREPAFEASSAKAETERVATREAIARLAAARDWAAMETNPNETIPQYDWTIESPARFPPQSEDGIPELGLAGAEPGLASSAGPGQDQANEPVALMRWSSSLPVVDDESAQSGSTEEGVGRTGQPGRVDPGHLVREATRVAADTASLPAGSDAGKRPSVIDEVTRRAEMRERVVLSSTLRETVAPDVGVRESAAVEKAASLVATSQADLLDAAESEAAALEPAARGASERHSAALEMAMRESEALGLAARRAAEQQVNTRVLEPARQAGVSSRLEQRIDAPDSSERVGRVRAVGEEREAVPRPSASDVATNRPVTPGAAAAGEPAAPSTSVEPVASFIDGYRSAFESGDVAALLAHFGPFPRENENLGRQWFEASYTSLFAGSSARRIRIAISDVIPMADDGWQIHGYYDMLVDYRDRAPVRKRGPVRYQVGWHAGGWRIDSIRY